MLIRGARAGAADAGSCTDSQRANKRRGGKKRGRKKALALAGPLATSGLGACGRHGPQRCRGGQPRRRRPTRFAALFSSLRSQEQPAAHSFDAEAAARQLAQALRSLADDRDNLATRLNALDREMRDMSGAIKQQIEAAKSEAIKTAEQAPPWPESAPPVPMTLADVAVMVETVSPAPAGAAEPPSPSVATSATNRTNMRRRHDRLSGRPTAPISALRQQ